MILQTRILWGLLILAAVLMVASFWQRPIHVDDSWFAEQAYWLAHEGVVRSKLLAGLLDYELRQFVYHKLHIWQTALAIEFFGLSLYALKALPFVYFVVFGVVLFLYTRHFYPRHARQMFMFALVLMMSSGLFVEHVFVNRPEIMLMCLGFISFVCLRFSLQADKQKVYALAGGVFAGLAGLAHLNGLVFVAAGAMLLLVEGRYRLFFVFCAGALAGFAPYFYEFLQPGNLGKYLYQFRHDPALSENEFSVWLLLGKVLSEPKRYFNHLLEGSYSLLLFVLLIWHRRSLVRHAETRAVLIYFVLLLLLVALVTPGKKNIYLLYGMPFALVLLAFIFVYLMRDAGKTAQRWGVGLLVFYLLVNYVDVGRLIMEQGVTPRMTDQVVRKFDIEQDAKVLGPHQFVFNQLGRLQLQSMGSFLIPARKQGKAIEARTLFAAAKARDRQFIILDGSYSRAEARDGQIPFEGGEIARLGLSGLERGERYFGYRYRGNVKQFHVFQRSRPASR